MNHASTLQLVVVISGRGSNMLAIAEACASGALDARVNAVIADRTSAAGLAAAAARGLPTRCIPAAAYGDRNQFDAALLDAIVSAGADVVVLAGFMRILSTGFVEALRGTMLNIHPSLLPLYPGLHTHRRVLAAGDSRHGATVHYVTPELDGGPAVLQGAIAVRANETENALSARVHTVEHIIYPRVLGWIASGRLRCPDGQPQLDGRPLDRPVLENFDV